MSSNVDPGYIASEDDKLVLSVANFVTASLQGIELKDTEKFIVNSLNKIPIDSMEKALEIDSHICAGFYYAYLKNNPTHHFKEYMQDYANRYKAAINCLKNLNESINSLTNSVPHQDLYYSNILKDGSYNKENFDEYGLLQSDPVRKFIDFQKDWYDTVSYDMQDHPGFRALYILRIKLMRHAKFNYMKQQIKYMDLTYQKRAYSDGPFMRNYAALKEKSCKERAALLKEAKANQLCIACPATRGKQLPLTYEMLLEGKIPGGINPVDVNLYQVIDLCGNEVPKEKVLALVKNISSYKEELVSMVPDNGEKNSSGSYSGQYMLPSLLLFICIA